MDSRKSHKGEAGAPPQPGPGPHSGRGALSALEAMKRAARTKPEPPPCPSTGEPENAPKARCPSRLTGGTSQPMRRPRVAT